MARRRKKTGSEIRREKLLEMSKDEDSLIGIMIDFKRKAVADRRRVVVDAEKAGIDAELAKRILVEEFGWGDSSDITKVSLYASRADDIEHMYMLFTYLEDTDDWGNKKGYTWEATVRIPLMFYIAATFDRYTVKMVEDHLDEIDGPLDWTLEAAHRDAREKYLRVMRNHNKNLPDDLRLWLELR